MTIFGKGLSIAIIKNQMIYIFVNISNADDP